MPLGLLSAVGSDLPRFGHAFISPAGRSCRGGRQGQQLPQHHRAQCLGFLASYGAAGGWLRVGGHGGGWRMDWLRVGKWLVGHDDGYDLMVGRMLVG